ncbi:ATP-binding protein [Streptomyces luteireticuli]|uniref:ATP-binding protein n=1 Tax=Streptomyces luteireticuli TaxID=173858 RepID=UPI0035573F4D
MTKLVRRPPGKKRPGNAPMASLFPRWLWTKARGAVLGFWHGLTVRREARGGITRPKKWRRWFSYSGWIRAFCTVATIALLYWFGQAIYNMTVGSKTGLEEWDKNHPGFDDTLRFIGPVLFGGLITAIFLFFWYGWTKRRYLTKACREPHDLVLTAGPQTKEVVGRQEIAQVIAQRLRDRATRRPYILVGGVGTGKTAVLVRLTELLAQQGAVPVPIRLRDAAGLSDLNFEQMAKRRFCEEAPQGILARGKTERVWQQLLADDKPVVIADGLEEAVLAPGLQEDRDNIIRRAIERAEEEKLPLVIASRPHTPLETTCAAIIELEPLSEESALDFVQEKASEADERRLDWIVETAQVTESPIYLQVARELSRHGLLGHGGPERDARPLNTRSRDRSELRLWLLETWLDALVAGRLGEDVLLSEEERRDAVEVVSALACVGLLQDKLEVEFEDLQGEHLDADSARRAKIKAGYLWSTRTPFDGARTGALPQWHRGRIWDELCENLGSGAGRRLRTGTPEERHAVLARCVAHAGALKLVEGFEKKVRFPHSILQAYLGFRMLRHLGADPTRELVRTALQPPGPSRELLIALVLLSRDVSVRTAAPEPGVRAGLKEDLRTWRRTALGQRPLAHALNRAAEQREDPKALELYAAALEVESARDVPEELGAIVSGIRARWAGIDGDPRTLEDAKLRVVRQLGEALRTADSKHPKGIDVTSLYQKLFELGIAEPSYSVRLAAAQEIGDGGDSAFAVIRRQIIDVDRDPVEEYETRKAGLVGRKRAELDEWEREQRRRATMPRPARRSGEGGRRPRERPDIFQEYRDEQVKLLTEFIMRAWMIPMLLGSVSDELREDARVRLTLWLRHLDPAEPVDLPLSLENALAQGFKYAANRRERHPLAVPGGRKELIRHAETMLRRSRCWYTQLILLQALCLWELPDTAAADRGDDGTRTRPANAVQTVRRWLSTAGTEHASAVRVAGNGAGPRTPLHPFVAEAGDLAALALETRRPERFLWIDEKGVADNIGSRNSGPQLHRKHHLWIPPSVGWSTLDARAQRLAADVLVMLNLIERDGQPDEVQDRLGRSQQANAQLPPCMTTDRTPLAPRLRTGTSVPPMPGSGCLPSCRFQLCPYPPRGARLRAELREPFCRQQQALLPGRLTRHLPRGRHRKTPNWVGMRVTELDDFWDKMAQRLRG